MAVRDLPDEAYAEQSQGFHLPAPVGGWNARDSLALMKPYDAIYLDNFFPSATEVEVRAGSALQATLPAGKTVQTLLAANKLDGTTRLLACAQDGVYDWTSGNPLGSVYAITNAQVESVNINIAGTHYLWCCNGTDNSFLYKVDTNTFAALTAASVPKLDGILSSNVVNVTLWKSRLILTEKNSLKMWYMPLASVGGTASAFDLGQIFRLGGYIVAIRPWTLDAGDGPDDRLVIVTSQGEVAVYAGTDPSLATAFALIGVFHIGKPIGRRCMFQYAGDLIVVTDQGVWPLSKALLSSSIDRRQALSDKIRNAFNVYYKSYGQNFGWQPVVYSQGPALLINVPISATVSEQIVMNTVTGSWCRFKNWNASCWLATGQDLYFALGNKITKAWTGTADGNGTITALAKTAFTYGPSHSRSKHIKLMRPVVRTSKALQIQLGLDMDFADGTITSQTANLNNTAAKWNEAYWNQAMWNGTNVMVNNWRTVKHKPGKAFAVRMRISVKNITAAWSSTDFIAQAGGLLG